MMPDSHGGRRLGDPLAAAALGVVGVVGIALSLQYGVWGSALGGKIGPGFVPLVASAVLAVLSLSIGVRWIVQRRQPSAELTSAEDTPSDQHMENHSNRGKSWKIWTITVVATILTRWLGFVTALGLAVLAFLIVVEGKRRISSVVYAGLAEFFFWVIFVWFLKVPVPEGILPWGF